MESNDNLVSLAVDEPIWDRFFSVFPLVVVGTVEADGSYDLAPKHLAIPMSWDNYFGFVCSREHHTYTNIERSGEFTVSYPTADQVTLTSLAASPRCEGDAKLAMSVLPTRPATEVEGVLLDGCYLYLECRLDRIVDDLGRNSLIIGEVVAASVDKRSLRHRQTDDQDTVHQNPLLAYLYPFRFASIENSQQFPKPAGFKR